MRKHTVKPGDSLSKIALKRLGDAGLWREIADLNRIPDPTKIKVGQVLMLPDEEAPEKSTRQQDVIITDEGNAVYYRYAGDATQRKLGNKHKLGLYRIGKKKPEVFLQEMPRALAGLKLSTSEVNALLATSKNEGNLDAVNTWDNSFVSFGMFQWTLGARDERGELPALLKLLKEKEPEAFEQYCGQFGVTVAADTTSRYGYLVYKGKKIKTSSQKKFLRSHYSAYRLAIAGADERVAAVQMLHAINRFDWFYFKKEQKLGGYAIHDLMSSEYAAALLLDQHVNRPGHVLKCVAQAAKETGRTFKQLANGDDRVERDLIKRYLAARAKTTMTHPNDRAAVTKKYLDDGRISAKRGSFKSRRNDRR